MITRPPYRFLNDLSSYELKYFLSYLPSRRFPKVSAPTHGNPAVVHSVKGFTVTARSGQLELPPPHPFPSHADSLVNVSTIKPLTNTPVLIDLTEPIDNITLVKNLHTYGK